VSTSGILRRRSNSQGLRIDAQTRATGPVAMSAGAVNRLSAAARIADDCGHGHDPASRHVHRGRQAV
jgi:hypothetical protein